MLELVGHFSRQAVGRENVRSQKSAQENLMTLDQTEAADKREANDLPSQGWIAGEKNPRVPATR
ncbi:MAG: hypothetical protein AB1898_32300 [Acidobacteriota bacterium]